MHPSIIASKIYNTIMNTKPFPPLVLFPQVTLVSGQDIKTPPLNVYT